YEYSMNGGTYQSNGSFTGLVAGTYTLAIRDANSCVVALATQTITEPALLSASVSKTDVSCNGASNGEILITSPTGGVPGYEYSMNGGTYQSNGSFTGLAAGTYTLAIRDANACVVALATQTITEPALLSASVSKTDVLCNGASNGTITISATGGTAPYSETGIKSGLAAGAYSYIVTDAKGCTSTVSVSIVEPAVIFASETHTDALCNGASDGTATISATGGIAPYSNIGIKTGLAAGTYSYTVTDANGCTSTISLEIGEPVMLIPGVLSGDTTICSGEKVNYPIISGNNANKITWQYAETPFTTWVTATNQEFPEVQEELYKTRQYRAQVSNSCGFAYTNSIIVTVNPLPNLNAGKDTAIATNKKVQLQATGGINYVWMADKSLSNLFIANPVASPAETTTYSVEATNEFGCKATDEITVSVVGRRPVMIPNTFTPNGDGTYDEWVIENIGDYPEASLEIYNRYGSIIIKWNKNIESWDGRVKGVEMAVGTYFYILDLKDGSEPMAGSVSIIR
ncbi:MAG: gliding motility-associated C-terminal domain-containing protein, partial [Sporocytophaga sp.]|uniref:T9SS type B sorting domain-containing protein n=1 Tax=Sporocytophaga sp. TaxID=2231183 RepID=UPI001B08F0C4